MRQASDKRITRWGTGLCIGLTLILSAAGCGGGTNVTVPLAVTLAPATVTALVGSSVQFSVIPNATIDSVSFLVNDVEGGNPTVGTITPAGLYQAPAVVPANTTITVKVKAADSATSTSAEATGTVTLDSGVRVSISPATFTIGTNEQFPFTTKKRVTGVPPNAAISGVCDADPLTGAPPCDAVTWSVSSGSGTIDGTTGNYAAPGSAGSATITATSVYDTSRTASATVTLIDAIDPTVTSIGNDVGAVGATQQDVYLSGSNFISTTQVLFKGSPVSDTDPINLTPTSTVLRVRLAASDLLAPGKFEFRVLRQGSTDVGCSSPCQLELSPQRPAIVGTTPDSINQNSTGGITVDGGYYGDNTTITGDFEGQNPTVLSANQLSFPLPGSSKPGLAPVTVTSKVPGYTVPSAVANVAIQPVYSTSLVPSASLSVGKQPLSVAINTATGKAVVVNQKSDSVALIDLAGPTLLGYICTATQGATLSVSEPSCPVSGPTSVAVDNLRNLALVTNSTTQTVAVIDLAGQSVSKIIPAGPTSIARNPWAVGINPLSGRAIVAYQSAGFASIIKMDPVPAVTGLVAASTGATPHVAVSPRLNWALVTPGSAGSLSIVDLGRQDTNPISFAVRTGNVVTITTGTAHALRIGDPVLITGVADTSFNGVFGVTGVSGNTFTYSQTGANVSSGNGTASYSLPIATVSTSLSVTGVGVNDETQKAILLDPDPSTATPARIFNLLDQTSTTVPGLAVPGATAGAFNPFTNIAVTVNKTNNNGAIVDPGTPALLGGDGIITGLNNPVDVAIDPGTNQAVVVNSPLASPPIIGSVSIIPLGSVGIVRPQVLQVSRKDDSSPYPQPPEVEVTSTLNSPAVYKDQTLTIIGSGFIPGSKVRLDGVEFTPTPTNVTSRQVTVTIPATAFTGPGATLSAGPRLYAVQVHDGTTASNAAPFTVSQSVDVTSAGCTAPAPQGVAIDYSSRNLAIVSNPGCNNVAIIHLDGPNLGTGTPVAVGNNPQGVAVHIPSALAVVANSDSNNASIVDLTTNTVVATVPTDPTPVGVAIDAALARAVVTARNGNVVDIFSVSATPSAAAPLSVQGLPTAVAVDPRRHLAAVTNAGSNTVSLVDLTQAAATLNITANGLPAGVAFDPVTSVFLTTSSLLNQVLVIDPANQTAIGLRVGINPTSIAYNFNSGTLVTTNSSSQTMSVMDFLSRRVRAVLSFKPSGRFAVDIHPFSNLAVIADSADNKVILRPLPR